jgi:hypothetical protein
MARSCSLLPDVQIVCGVVCSGRLKLFWECVSLNLLIILTTDIFSSLPNVYAVQFDLDTKRLEFRSDSTGVFYTIIYIPSKEYRLTIPNKFVGIVSIYFGYVEKLAGRLLYASSKSTGFLNYKTMLIVLLLLGRVIFRSTWN